MSAELVEPPPGVDEQAVRVRSAVVAPVARTGRALSLLLMSVLSPLEGVEAVAAERFRCGVFSVSVGDAGRDLRGRTGSLP
jgi:hypothetical protein